MTKDIFGRQAIRRVNVSLDEKLLRRIAEETGGQYFNVKDPRGLEDALEDISELETTRVERDIYTHYNELFPRFLYPALALLVMATSLNMLAAKRLV